MEAEDQQKVTFQSLGLSQELTASCARLNYSTPTPIQRESIPYSLQNKDIIALAETGSGKTLAFVLPILQNLLVDRRPFYAIILSPTRELCAQISDHFKAVGSQIGVKTAVIVGGLNINDQIKLLKMEPHIIVGTPGKLLYHMENTKCMRLSNLKYLVMDEADKLLSMDFQQQINTILANIPQKRTTFLFSATMTDKVQKLERASLKDPVRIEVSDKYKTVDTLIQEYLFLPSKFKEVYISYLISNKVGNQIIIFTATCMNALKICLLLRKLGHRAVTINGQMSQAKRLGSLARFKAKQSNILVATDVASRGLDIPSVDMVFNYDLPGNTKDYVHRVGRTARAGRAGRALTFVSQYDIQEFQRIESLIEKKMQEHKIDSSAVMQIKQQVDEAVRIAVQELKIKMEKKGLQGEKTERKLAKFTTKDRRKKMRNMKKRVVIDI